MNINANPMFCRLQSFFPRDQRTSDLLSRLFRAARENDPAKENLAGRKRKITHSDPCGQTPKANRAPLTKNSPLVSSEQRINTYSDLRQTFNEMSANPKQLKELDALIKIEQELLQQFHENFSSADRQLDEIQILVRQTFLEALKGGAVVCNFSQAMLEKIFSLENELRDERIERVQNASNSTLLYQEQIKALVSNAKEAIKARPIHFSAKAAANKGKAACAGLNAIAALIEKGIYCIKKNTESSQEVFLLPGVAVLKLPTAQAKEEGDQIEALFALKIKNSSLIGTFDIERVNMEKEKIKWKVKGEDPINKLKTIQAKPFVDDMRTFHELSDDQIFLEKILERLTLEDQASAILTSEFQFLDLHTGNIAVAPESNEAYERFKTHHFYLSRSQVSFDSLLRRYLKNEISPETFISFDQNGAFITEQLKNLPDLCQALEVRWRLIIFDTDLALSEDNRLQKQFKGQREGHLIPLRSAFLSTEWKDKALNPQVLEIINQVGTDKSVREWMARSDAPIYAGLPANIKSRIQNRVNDVISAYNLSRLREKGYEPTVARLRKRFIQEISVLKTSHHRQFWQAMESDLNYDLTSPQAWDTREWVAGQLFPRLTLRQQTALIERQERRRSYLDSYQELTTSQLEGESLFQQIEAFIRASSTPLGSYQREQDLNFMINNKHHLLNHPRILSQFHQKLLRECQPTFFNLTKAMYPLLADAYHINYLVEERDAWEAGKRMGSHQSPIEKMIYKAQLNSEMRNRVPSMVIQHLEEQIQNIQNPAFFGRWS